MMTSLDAVLDSSYTFRSKVDDSVAPTCLQQNNSTSVPPQQQNIETKELPNLIRDDHSHCDACRFCADTCSNADCNRCSTKRKLSIDRTHQMMYGDLDTAHPFRLFLSNKTEKKEFFVSRCQVRRHKTADSAWLLCGDTVYDATQYLKSHPGGEQSILRKSGGVHDCTKDMKFHSSHALRSWKKNKVGFLKACPGCSPDLIGIRDISDNSCVIS